MILFSDDWSKFPTASVHMETKNDSFLKLASVYKAMKVKNYAFILTLINSELRNIDPHDPNLDQETQLKIGVECVLNPWYFFREVLRLPGKSGNDTFQLKANRGNIALFWCFFNHIFSILIQPRQTGKSISSDSLMIYLLCLRCTGISINLLTKDETLRSANIKRIKEIEECLPGYLRLRTRNDTNNTETYTVKAKNNIYRGLLPQKSEKLAFNVGRGLTSEITQIDEPVFQSHIKIILETALSSGTAAREIAHERGEPYGTILTTTAGKKDDRDGKYIFDILNESCVWSEHFFDCSDPIDLEKKVRQNSRNGFFRMNLTFSHRQLGKDDKWLKKALEDSVASGENARRDYLNEWTSGSQSSPLPVHILESLKKSKKDVLFSEISNINGYITRWYIEEKDIAFTMMNGRFVLATDTSDASGGDDISLVLVDVKNFKVIAAGNYNETNLITFARWLAEWLIKYPNITLIPERKSSAITIIDYLLLILPSRGIDPFRRIFNMAVNFMHENKQTAVEISLPVERKNQDIFTKHKKTFGFATSGSGITSRSELYSTVLNEATKKASDVCHDSDIINQICSLERRNGRIDHPAGEHDDMVIAWLLCFWLLTKAQNLHFYGIQYYEILSEIEDSKPKTIEEYYDREEQRRIRSEIEEIYERLKRERNDAIIYSLENSLKNLNNRIILQDGEIFSVDELIQNLKKERKNLRLMNSQNNYFSSMNDNNYSQKFEMDNPFYM